MRILLSVAAAMLCAGCVTTESVQFKPTADQQSVVRDGQAAIVSKKRNSLVIVRPAARQFRIGGRPVFVVAIYNRTGAPEEFRVGNIRVTQVVNGEAAPLKIITYEMLVQEERNRQTLAAIGAGLSVAGNAISASRAGYYNSNSTVYTPRGAYSVHTSGYDPVAASIAQSNANAQNAHLVEQTIVQGQANMARLERGVIKDDTIMPGEWYGGQLHIQPLVSDDSSMKNYTIGLQVGADYHEIVVTQGNPTS